MRYIKKVLLCMLGLLTLFMPVSDVFGAVNLSGVSGKTTGYYINGYNINTMPEGKLSINGKVAWCIEPDNGYSAGSGKTISFTSADYKGKKHTKALEKKCCLIAWFGYYSVAHTNRNYYITQNTLWRAMGSKAIAIKPGELSASQAESEISKLMSKVNNASKNPSFHNKTYTIKERESLTLTDTNQVLSGLSVKSNGGYQVSKSNNQLKIQTNTTSPTNGSITFSRGFNSEMNKVNLVARHGNAQAVSTLTMIDDYDSKVTIKVMKKGTGRLIKTDKNGKQINGASFKITGNGIDKTVIVSGSYDIQLEPGTYKVVEVKAPNGYLIDKTVKTLSIVSGKVTSLTFKDDVPTGVINLEKSSQTTTNRSLSKAVYTIYSDASCKNKVGTMTTDSNGKASYKNLALGTYYVKETSAPVGFDLDQTIHKVTLSYKDMNTSIVTGTVKSVETPWMTSVSIHKTNQEKTPLKGAKFGIYANETIYVGSTKKVKGQLIQSVITDEKGYAHFSSLPYGKYYIQEIEAPEGYELDDEKHTFSITTKTVLDYTFINDLSNGGIQLFKRDSQGKIQGHAHLKDALYGVYDENHKKVGEMSTNNVGIAKIQNLDLDASRTYYIKEEKAPVGYLLDNKEYKVVFEDKDIQEITLEKLTVNEEVIQSKLHLYKTSDDKTPLKDCVFGIYLKDDMTIGDKDYEKDTLIETLITDEKGEAISSLLPYGSYYVKEVSPTKGYIKSDKTYDFEIVDTKDVSLNVVNHAIQVSKTDVTKEKEIEGAKLRVLDEEGEVVDEWTSGKNPHFIQGLVEGKTYTLEETVAPQDYMKTSSITFTAGESQHIQMIDKQVKVSKTDVTKEKEIEGAKLRVLDEEGEVVDEWTSGKMPHYLQGLVEGEKYTLEETVAPQDYMKTSSITFIAGETDYIHMVDKQVKVSKTDITKEKEIEGAKLRVLDEEGEVVDEWTSGNSPHYIQGLVEGEKYTLEETVAPQGYMKTSSISFVAGETDHIHMIDKQVQVVKVNKEKHPLKGAILQVLDDDKNVIDEWITTNQPHNVNHLEEGKTYILHEVKAPVGYMICDDISFSSDDTLVEMIDKAGPEFSKIDMNGKEIGGAKMIVKDKDNHIVDTWISKTSSHIIRNLIEGETYTLTEITSPDGYNIAESQTFIAGKTKELKMKDTRTGIRKTDLISGEEVQGASLSLYDENHEKVDEWITDGTVHYVTGLKVNHSYQLVETNPATGYKVAQDIIFAPDASKDTLIEMKDEPILSEIHVQKRDSTTHKPIKMSVTFGLYEDKDCTKLIEELTGKGDIRFKNLRYGTYYLKELKAPVGYVLSDEVIKIEVNDKNKDIIHIDYDNTPVPVTTKKPFQTPRKVETGDPTQMMISLAGMVASITLLIVLLHVRHKNEG